MRRYILSILITVALSASGIIIIVSKFDPYQTGQLIKFLFFSSLFVLIWGVSSLVLLGLKNDLAGAFRRGLWPAILILIIIWLNRLNLLNILNLLIVLGVVMTIEFFLIKIFRNEEK